MLVCSASVSDCLLIYYKRTKHGSSVIFSNGFALKKAFSCPLKSIRKMRKGNMSVPFGCQSDSNWMVAGQTASIFTAMLYCISGWRYQVKFFFLSFFPHRCPSTEYGCACQQYGRTALWHGSSRPTRRGHSGPLVSRECWNSYFQVRSIFPNSSLYFICIYSSAPLFHSLSISICHRDLSDLYHHRWI